jgi:AraC family transcriptional activator of pobA
VTPAGARPDPRDIAVDHLPEAGPSLEVLLLDDASFGGGADGPRPPHRHDYHELIWTRAGTGSHLVDGERSPVTPGTVTLIGRGQVHVFEHGRDLTGAVVRFGSELLHDAPSAARAAPTWLLGGSGARTVAVPSSEAARFESTIEALAAESRRPLDACAIDLQRHLLTALLLWLERWYDAPRTRRREADDADVLLHRRFADILERDFARHHEAVHYADALAVPPAALSRALAHVTGRPTKELITDRVMLEAARLLRFTDLTIGEVAFRTGFRDQLYFSRAFKRRYGLAPTAYRTRLRGLA